MALPEERDTGISESAASDAKIGGTTPDASADAAEGKEKPVVSRD